MPQLEITELESPFGAEIRGFEPGRELGGEDEQALQRAFDERGLLVFRGLEDLSLEDQCYLASTAIGMEDVATSGSRDDDAFYVSNKRERGGAPYGRLLWHSDMMWAETPFQVLTLHAVDVEEPAVPTMFAGTAAAWETLPDDLRARVDDLHATHQTGQQSRGDKSEGELLDAVRETVREVTKPVALEHPRTGQTLLFVGEMNTREIAELDEQESEDLLGELFAHLYDPATVYQHPWQNGDLVMWDNLTIQHARANVELEGPVRTLRKVIAPRDATRNLETPKFSKVR